MKTIWTVTLLLILALAAGARVAEESPVGAIPRDEAGLRALPGAKLSKPTATQDGGQSRILTYRGAKIEIRTAADGTRTVEQVDGTGAPPVLCAWQMVVL